MSDTNRAIEENDLVIKFSNPKAARYFALWLCESGEQDYWNWMEYREEKESGDITATTFHYHNSGKFMKDNTICSTSGRVSDRK